MRRTSALAVLALVLFAPPLAAADEGEADCEPGQPWAGDRSTLVLREAYHELGAPGGANVCEGEHWDGQDEVQPGAGASESGFGCLATRADADDLFVGYCMGPANGAERERDVATFLNGGAPAGARLSSTGGNQAFAGVDAMHAGKAMLYVGTQDGHTIGLYLRDNTPRNALATAVGALGLTHGYVAEGDCTQEEYQRDHEYGMRPQCGRDNTALTVELLG